MGYQEKGHVEEREHGRMHPIRAKTVQKFSEVSIPHFETGVLPHMVQHRFRDSVHTALEGERTWAVLDRSAKFLMTFLMKAGSFVVRSLRTAVVAASRSRAETTFSSSRLVSNNPQRRPKTGSAAVVEESVFAKGKQRFVNTFSANSRADVSGWSSTSSIHVAPASFGSYARSKIKISS